ncbi:MAG: two-component regulator propeller domain-containing protein, partial [Pseudoxanthomonas sp.]
MGKTGWLLVLLFGVLAQARAGVPEIPRLRVLGPNEGLPSTGIPALARDRQGYLWLATWDGLARYDGVGFRVWRHDPAQPASLPGNMVQALYIDTRDRVWVGTEHGGLSVLDAQRRGFTHYTPANHPQMQGEDVFAIAGRGEEIWFGTFGGGLHRLDASGRITRWQADPARPDGLPDDTIMALAFDPAGTLYIGTYGGLARMQDGQPRRVALAGADPIVYGLQPDGDTLWVGAADGVYRFDRAGRWTRPPWSPMFARPNALLAIVGDGQGEYWIGSQGGLWRTRGSRAPVPVGQDAQGRGVGRVLQTLLREPDGGLWAPLPTRGLGYLRPDWQRIAALSTAQGLDGGIYLSLGPARDGGVWLGNSLGRIDHLDLASGAVAPLPWRIPALANMRVFSLLQDRAGRLWVGASPNLVRIDPASGRSRRWTPGQGEDATPGSSVTRLLQAGDGSLWLLTQAHGLQRRDPDRGRVLDRIRPGDPGLEEPDVQDMRIAPDGSLWLAARSGLEYWDAQARALRPVPGIGGERVFNFLFQAPDQLWLHRLSGLEQWRLRGGRWQRSQRIGAAQGLPVVESTGLQQDRRGRLWLTTRRGLVRVTAQDAVAVRSFGVRDGLLGQEFNQRGLIALDNDVLVGATADGSLTLLDTAMPDPPPRRPNLVLSGVQFSRGDRLLQLPVADGFVLRPGDHELTVNMRLLAFEDPAGNRYRSWLQGLDPDWVEQGSSGERVFSVLPPGRYRLRAQAFDTQGNPSVERSLSFSVAPPWWRSGWGMVGFALLGLAALVLLARAYRGRVRRRAAWRLEQHKRELAEQASQAKTRFLATLGHEVRTPMTGVLGMSELLLATPLDARQRGYARSIRSAGEQLLRLVNDALDLARIEAGKLDLVVQDFDLREVVDAVAGLVAPLARRRGLDFACTVAADVPPWLRGDPLRLRQILLNLASNAVKFSERGRVAIEAAARPGGGIVLRVSDTGPGIGAEQQARLFQRFEQAEGARTAARYGGSGLGLAICRELAAAMDGRIRVESALGQGACYIVQLPWPAAGAPAAAADPAPPPDPARRALL